MGLDRQAGTKLEGVDVESRRPHRDRADGIHVSLVVPVLDEARCVSELTRRVDQALRETSTAYEIVFVDDGSSDGTDQAVLALRSRYPGVKLIRFTRTFGHQMALVAGIRLAKGDVVVTMDGDLQQPPELLPELIERWRAGADIVNTVRKRAPHRSVKDRLSDAFYRLLNRVGSVEVLPAGPDFRLLDRRVVDVLNDCPERFLFVRGLLPWLGFASDVVFFEAAERHAGSTKYHLRRRLRLGFDGVFGFSILPLRIISLMGIAMTALGTVYGVFAAAAHFAGKTQTGWTSLVVVVIVFGGLQLIALGLLSEYVGRIYDEVKQRPRYVVDRLDGFEDR